MAVTVEEIRDLADRIAIRLELGQFVMRGPQENIMELESRVAWSTIAGQLHHEGYVMVTPEEYAAKYSLSPAEVEEKLEGTGTLFALSYGAHDETLLLVPLEEREAPEHLGPLPK